MNLVPENINEAIKHLTPRSQEEINEKLDKEIKKWIKTHNVIDGMLEYLGMENDEDERDSIMSYIIAFIPEDILPTVIKNAVEEMRRILNGE